MHTFENAVTIQRPAEEVFAFLAEAMLRLAVPLATPRIKAAVAQNLGKLRLVLEGGQPA